MPSPQPSEQSLSEAWLAPAGQQPSPAAGWVISVCAHAAVQLPPFCSVSAVQATPSSQAVGQAPVWPAAIAVSQVSPVSTTPLPQPAGQSGSELMSAPGGQQLSPAAGAVIAPCTHCSWQPVPEAWSVV